MNNLITTNNGGFPVVLDDLRFNQQATRDALYGLLSAFGVSTPQSFIISGCVIASYSIGGAYSAGWISLNGEILKVDAGVLPTPGLDEDWYWALDVSYDPAGTKAMENSTTAQAYEVRKAKVISASSGLQATLTTATLASKMVSIVSADNANTDLANKIMAVIAASGLYDSNVVSWKTYTPTLSALDGSDATVAGGFTGTAVGKYIFKNKTLFLKISVTALATLSTVTKLRFNLPVSVTSPYNAVGFNIGKYYNSSTYSTIQASISLRWTGAGNDLCVANFDGSAFGAHSGGTLDFEITIGFQKDGE